MSFLGAGLIVSGHALAAPPPGTPVVVPQDPSKSDATRNLKNVPDNVKTLILNFDQTRDYYLKQQQLLLTKLHNASTEEAREKVRDQLQDNRKEFLADLKSFREQLKDDLKDLKSKISHSEFQRIIDAAGGSAQKGQQHHHKGH
jgi:vacuolar-type H+-ATPase subunit H